jgi:uncharacterized repeat protein (TIGR01451 family)
VLLLFFLLPISATTRADATRSIPEALPLIFELNAGQANPEVKFLSRGAGYTLFLTPAEMVLGFLTSAPEKKAAVLHMKFSGANVRPRVVGLEELQGKVNYFVGDDPAHWRVNVPTYAKVRYESIYPGVDLIYYGNQRQFEYDFVVAPGADPKVITLAFEGPDNLAVDAEGDLLFQVGSGELRLRKPLVYQEVGGSRKLVEANYVLKSKDHVGVQVAAYDSTRPLIIDPVLVYSTYVGGSGAEISHGIAADPGTPGIVYVTGETTSTNFPTTAIGFQPGFGKGTDCFVASFNTNQSGPASRIYSTYLGGSGNDQCYGVAADASHNAYVVGRTTSTNFPLATKLNGNNRGGSDAIVMKLNAAGSALLYSVYLGGSADEWGFGIAVDGLGQAYVTGRTTSTNFPVVGGFQTALGDPSGDAFITKINAAGNAFLYSTYLGGNGLDQGQGIVADPLHPGIVYVTGDTSSTNFANTNGFQLTTGGNGDAFVAKVNTTAAGPASLLYSTYLGGSGADHGFGIATDGVSAYVTGQTASINLYSILAPPKSFDTQLSGSSDAFVARIDTASSGQASVSFFTYLGGVSDDSGNAIAVDAVGDVYVTGQTFGGFPVTLDAFQPAFGGNGDAFVARVNTFANGEGALVFASYLGGSGIDQGNGIALDTSGNGYIAGTTSSAPFPTTPGGFQTTYGGATDAFVARIVDIAKTADLSITKSGPASVSASSTFAYTLSVSNAGPNPASAVSVKDALPGGVTLVSASGSGWNCSGTTTTPVTCTMASLAVGNAPGITITVRAPSAAATLSNSASVSSATPELDPTNNTSATIQTTVMSVVPPPQADLSISKTGPATVNASSQFTYALNVSNAGPDAASNVSVSDTLPVGVTLVGVSGTGWTCGGGATVTCTIASLASGTASTITISVTAPAQGITLLNSASVTATTGDPNTGNNTSATVQTTVASQADLSITKTGPTSANASNTISYTLSVNNAGPSTASAVSASDTLPAGATLVSASGSGWSCIGTSTVTCTLASLAVGAAPDIILTVTAPATGGTISNQASVSSATGDTNTTNNTSATVQTVVSGPPIFTGATSYQVNEGTLLTFQVAATDPGGKPLTFSASNLPNGASFNTATQTFTWTPNSAQGGPSPYLVYLTASDGQYFATTPVTITVVDTIADRDGDGVPDAIDNCPDHYNPDQFPVCGNRNTGTAFAALPGSTATPGPLLLNFTVTLDGGPNGTYALPANIFNSICRVTDNATGLPVPLGGVAEGPPLNLSVNGDLIFIPVGSSRQFTTTFDLRLFYPTLVVGGSYTANCAHAASAHIPLPAPDDPTIWQGTLNAPAQMVSSYPFGFSSPVDHQPFNQGRTVPVKFSLRDSTGAFVSTCVCTLTVQQLDANGNLIGSPIPATPNSGSGNTAQYDASTNQYQYNMSTDLLNIGPWLVQVHMSVDNTTRVIAIVIR